MPQTKLNHCLQQWSYRKFAALSMILRFIVKCYLDLSNQAAHFVIFKKLLVYQ